MLTHHKKLVYILPFLFSAFSHASGEDSIRLEPVVITSTRIDSGDNMRVATRNSDSVIIDEEKSLSYPSVPSILKIFSLADIRTRGPYGVQSDISLRGAPFEENLVLIDGLSVNDPKSGHHNMDLPLTMHDIKRLEITYGPASSIYGAGAIGGAVNIVPKKPDENLEIYTSSVTGSWDFYSGSASLNIPAGALKSRNSVEWKRGTGYAPETEFNMLTASSYSEADLGYAKCAVFLGYLTKKFGADSFYSDLYPNEEESMNTGLLIAKAEINRDRVYLKPVFYWKRLQDKFILDRNRRNFSRNDHTTNSYGGEITSSVETALGAVAFGGAVGSEEISSTNLGDHNRVKTGAFLEYEKKFSQLLFNTSARLDYYSTFNWQFSPSVNAAYQILPSLTVRAGAAKAFRAPTFTELYYSSPANVGNPDLKCEEARSYDAGFNYKTHILAVSGTVFLRNADSVIDWTRSGSSGAWQADNIGKFDLYGLEGSMRIELKDVIKISVFKSIAVKYGYMEALDKKGITSKYVLEYLKHNLKCNLECELPFGLREDFNFGFAKRIGDEGYLLLDSTLYKDIDLDKGKMSLFLKFSNIFNTKYTEEGNVKMPGFGVFGGGSVEF